MKLEIKFNEQFNQAQINLQGDGTYIIDVLEYEPDVLVTELADLIMDYTPKYLFFTSYVSGELIDELYNRKVCIDSDTNRVVYN